MSGYKRLCVGDIAEAAYLSGDMHSVKKIAENGNYGEKDREKISRALAGVYFDSGDMENLKKICNDSPVAGRTDPLWSYYGAYLDGDYLKCAYVCAESFRKVLSKADKVVSVYLLAVAEYAAGDFENAEENFRKVIANGKYLNCVKISELYLESLYTGRPYITEKNAL